MRKLKHRDVRLFVQVHIADEFCERKHGKKEKQNLRIPIAIDWMFVSMQNLYVKMLHLPNVIVLKSRALSD